jgi:hypothetical protein
MRHWTTKIVTENQEHVRYTKMVPNDEIHNDNDEYKLGSADVIWNHIATLLLKLCVCILSPQIKFYIQKAERIPKASHTT